MPPKGLKTGDVVAGKSVTDASQVRKAAAEMLKS